MDDALFPLDGFDEEEEEVDGGKGGVAFPQSDDEESGTDGQLTPLSLRQCGTMSSAPRRQLIQRPILGAGRGLLSPNGSAHVQTLAADGHSCE